MNQQIEHKGEISVRAFRQAGREVCTPALSGFPCYAAFEHHRLRVHDQRYLLHQPVVECKGHSDGVALHY